MKAKVLIASLVLLAATTLLILSQTRNKAFSPAEDFPRGALVYVQVSDLPGLIRLWEESEFKAKYLKSKNFDDFKVSHLAIKLESRWEEFNGAAGFEIDLATLSGLTEKRAALALYDIGKLEFVFIAPMRDEIFAGTKFLQNRDRFEEIALADGTTVYRVDVAADRGRQKQEMIFTCAKGRFVLATSEKLLAQTLANINGSAARQSSLAEEPSFNNLTERAEPRMASIWVNQTALNDDYYFKRYWLPSHPAELKNIRSGVFDFSKEEGRLVERRIFLLDQPVNSSPPEAGQTEKSLAFLPEDIPFYRLQPAAPQTLEMAVLNTLFERLNTSVRPTAKSHQYAAEDFYDYTEFGDYRGQDYSYLGEKFDQEINEEIESPTDIKPDQREANFSRVLLRTKPKTILIFTRPKLLPAPLFVEFQRAAIFRLDSPGGLDRNSFESAIESVFLSQLMASSPGVKLKWETSEEKGMMLRGMNLPALSISASYAVCEDQLILANNIDFLREIIASQDLKRKENLESPFSELTVLNLGQRDEAYDQIFARLLKSKSADAFFSENISSLLESSSAINRIEVKRGYLKNFLQEEVIINFK